MIHSPRATRRRSARAMTLINVPPQLWLRPRRVDARRCIPEPEEHLRPRSSIESRVGHTMTSN